MYKLSDKFIRFIEEMMESSMYNWQQEEDFSGGARGVMVIVTGYGYGDTSSIPGQVSCISHSSNTLGKGMNPIILPPAWGK